MENKELPNTNGRDFNDGCTIGAYTYGTVNTSFCGQREDSPEHSGTFTIGRYCSIGHNVVFLCGGEHHTDWVTTYPFNILQGHVNDDPNGHNEPFRKNKVTGRNGDIVVGNDVWLGRNAMVLNGVTIGDGCIIGAGAVVTRDCEPFGVYVGNPAKCVRMRFGKEERERLLKVKWWDFDIQYLQPYMHLLQSKHIHKFLDIMENIT